MNIETYMKLIGNTLKYQTSGYILQKIINDLRKSGVAKYNNDENGTKVKIDSDWDKVTRVCQCLNEKPESTIQYIEKMLITKGYRYSIYFRCSKFKIEDTYENYNLYDDYLPIAIKNIDDFSRPILKIDKDRIIIKFEKSIDPYYPEINRTENIIDSTLWIYHKNLEILEFRFNNIALKGNDDFYQTTLNAQLDILRKRHKLTVEEFRTSEIIEEIVTNKKKEVHLICQDLGLMKDSSAKLKVGNNMVMPFIGDLEEIIENNSELLNSTKEAKKVSQLFIDYVNNIKENAKYKTRLLSWYDSNGDSKLNINVTFSYRDRSYDLYNFLEIKKIDMEMMNYAIEYIYQIFSDIRNNK
ncbi:hypothetical protein DVV81_08105 [Clostridium botulinum]|uniref:hypothetical protein n=1 Tax=Clostridium botulinum TaxID=1491 RepID=UPI001966E8C3|nr:hypothetical protein [Clostridium botulinum]MBN1071131.1 hypothetical protein [Clostridium botulinum]